MNQGRIAESELILNPDGSIYHLDLKPGEIGHTIILVGDPQRVERVSNYFDQIELKREHREFCTHTGTLRGKRLSVVSTGIGTDNIDIVFNELDALVNIDLETRQIRQEHTQLDFIRVGTSGSLQKNIPVDSLLASHTAIGFDNLPHFYRSEELMDRGFIEAFVAQTNWDSKRSEPYVLHADKDLLALFADKGLIAGCTTTNVGFYGPQGRVLRLELKQADLNQKIASFRYHGQQITNLEMETSGIYAMAQLLGHRALSLNAILANRPNGTFSTQAGKTVDCLIALTLDTLCP